MTKQEIFKVLIEELKNQKDVSLENKIATNLENNYNIPVGVTYSFTAKKLDDKFYKNTDIRLITLFIIEAFKVFGRQEQLNKYITDAEEKEAKQYDYFAQIEKSKIKLPYDFFPVVPVNNVYSTKISVGLISDFLGNNIINYNFDIQREAKLEVRTEGIIKKPTLNKRNIVEMEKLLLNEGLKESTIYLNAAPMTATNGEELIYDESTYKLTITEGTRLDVLDGFHRILAAQQAYSIDPNIEFEFNVVFSNFTTAEAIKWQAQHAKATAWSGNRVTELQQDSKAAKVVKAIKDSSVEFSNAIYTSRVGSNKSKNTLVSFKYLTETIDALFSINNRRDEAQLSEELSEVLLEILEVKQSSTSTLTQTYVFGLLKLYAEDYRRDRQKFFEFLKWLEDNSNKYKVFEPLKSQHKVAKNEAYANMKKANEQFEKGEV